MPKTYSTVQVAKLIGVNYSTLHRWIREKSIEAPPIKVLEGMLEVRLWTEKDVEKVRKYKEETFWGKGLDRRKGKRSKQQKKK